MEKEPSRIKEGLSEQGQDGTLSFWRDVLGDGKK